MANAARVVTDLRGDAMIGAVLAVTDRHEENAMNVAAASGAASGVSINGTEVAATASQGRPRCRARK